MDASDLFDESRRYRAADEAFHLALDLASISYKKIMPDVQHILAKYNNLSVRYNLALNPGLTLEIQHILAKDDHVYVRGNLAINVRLFPEIQYILAKDKDHNIRHNLARNSYLIPEVKSVIRKMNVMQKILEK